jgi:hypothetical protein
MNRDKKPTHMRIFLVSVYYTIQQERMSKMRSLCFPTFLKTTDPHTPYSDIASKEVAISIVFHVAAYFFAYYGLVKLFRLPYRPRAILLFLLLAMTFGFYGRLYRVKTMFETYLEQGLDPKEAREKATTMLRTGYFTWYFLS